ncbi:MAG: hypothetical protein Q3968_02875 [Clostridiaceae bacterium]|nr:hypothetical protein [Clostridiaceae bacterium]
MKKVLAVFVAISLLFVMCVPAFAGENVDALTDEKQVEIAGLVLDAIDQGMDVSSISGRIQIGKSVVNGISDIDSYKEAYEADESSIKTAVAAAVAAVKADVGFSDTNANMLVSEITKAIKDKINPEETTTPSETEPEETEPLNDNIDTIYSILSNLPFDQLKDVMLTLLGNGIINKTDAKYIIDKLKKDGKISADQVQALLDSLDSEEANTSSIEKFFEGYTPADLSALFRGFGDAIATMTSALANLLRSGGGDDNNGGNGNGGNGNGGNTTPADIPPTGDYAIPAVAAVALLAGAAFVLTRKKTEE